MNWVLVGLGCLVFVLLVPVVFAVGGILGFLVASGLMK